MTETPGNAAVTPGPAARDWLEAKLRSAVEGIKRCSKRDARRDAEADDADDGSLEDSGADEGTSGYLIGPDRVEAIMRAAEEYAGRGDGGAQRIRVTATDLGTGDSSTAVIEDDYVIICAGTCHRHHVEHQSDGTHVITVKGRRQGPERQGGEPS